MKNSKVYLIVALMMSICCSTIAQNSEIKINGPLSLAGFLEGTYERILNDESSVGLSLGYAYEDDFYFNLAAIPYYRLFFGKKRASGFFVEGSGVVFSQDYTAFNEFTSETSTESDMGYGLGLAVGFKLTTKSNWVFDIFAGAGRNFNNKNIDGGYPRIGINLGRRF